MDSPVRITRILVLLSIALFYLMPLHAIGKTPEQIFSEVSRSIVVVIGIAKDAKDSSQGTGVVVAPNTVATNCHVLTSANQISVRYRASAYVAILKYQNWDLDLCILDVTGMSAQPLKALVSVGQLRVGQPVYAIGTPLGLELTLTDGLISGFRKLGSRVLIQTSVSIAPGSSGGGLFNSDGNLIGITSAGIPAFQGFNFAVPVDWIAAILASPPPVASAKLSETTQKVLSASLFADIEGKAADQAAPFLAFDTVEQARDWLDKMSSRLENSMPDRRSREEFLVTVHFEAKRAGLDPQLVLGLIQIVSGFRKYLVSKHGARGYMQVMPYWVKQIGEPAHNLFNLRTNLRYGCTILRYYLDKNNVDYFLALSAYGAEMDPNYDHNGAEFPNRVVRAWIANWKYEYKPALIAPPGPSATNSPPLAPKPPSMYDGLELAPGQNK